MSGIKDRLLVVGSSNAESGLREVLQFLKSNYSTEDEKECNELKGVIEPLNIKTKYYSVSIDLLIDVLGSAQGISEWTEELLDDELEDLRDALNGLVLCIDKKDDADLYIQQFQKILKKLSSEKGEELGVYAWNGMFCIVLFGDFDDIEIEEVEDVAVGIEVVHFDAKNEFNEYKERLGRSRLKEMIEIHDWKDLDQKENTTQEEVEEDDFDEDDDDDDDHDDDDEIVEDLDDIMARLKQAKLEISMLPKEEQDKFAQRLAQELTNELF